jgi:plastocyanin
MSVPSRRPSRLLLLLAVTVATLGLCLVFAGGPALAQTSQSKGAEVDGTAANKWEPAQVTVRPGDTVTFKVAGGATHPVGSGTAPPGDKKFDASGCQLKQMTNVGDTCTVKFPKEGSFPFFCEVHFALGMTGTVTVSKTGAGSAGATSSTAAGGNSAPVVSTPEAATAPSSGRPAIYWAGWGLFALGALLALAFIALYVRFLPSFGRGRR